MEEPVGSVMEKLIGVGKRRYRSLDGKTNELLPVTNFYYSYFSRMVRTFEMTPIVKTFGINIKDALAMPINQWYEIERQAKMLADRPQAPDAETRMLDMMKQFMEVMGAGKATE